MTIKLHSLFRYLTIIFSSLLATSCLNDNNDPQTQLSGVVIKGDNYRPILTVGYNDTANRLSELMDSGNGVKTTNLTILRQAENLTEYYCDNPNGTLVITKTNPNTEKFVFNDCKIEINNKTNQFDGISHIKTSINSGLEAHIGSSDNSWNITRDITFENFSQTLTIKKGRQLIEEVIENLSNGVIVVDSSNDALNSLETRTLKSSNITIVTTETDGNKITRELSDVYYDTFINHTTGNKEIDLDLGGEITTIGTLLLKTVKPIELASNNEPLSGSAELSTGASTLKFTTEGHLRVSIDSENNGDFEVLPVDIWGNIGGDHCYGETCSALQLLSP